MTTILDKFNLANHVAFVTGGIGLLGTELCRTLAEPFCKLQYGILIWDIALIAKE